MKRILVLVLAGSVSVAPTALMAQSQNSTQASVADDSEALMTGSELQELVAPIALYPDTLLIQILVAATYPLDVVKADRLVRDNSDKSNDEKQALIEAEGWDESVNVLAEAFPDVLADMAVHIEWTETMGEAMLAQSDDVMVAVQNMRAIANDNGALQSGEEQTIEVTQDAGEQTIIIQPTDPQVVYVPQYKQEVVYVDNNSPSTGDIVGAGLITFGTIALINEIFDDDDHWHGYWGCGNCGGWNGRPIIHNPDIDIDIHGDVNIGGRDNIGWKPDDDRRDKARDHIRQKRDPELPGRLETRKPDRGDEMRQRLSRETGTADISQPGVDRSNVNRPAVGNLAKHKPAIDRTRAPALPQAGGGAAKARPKVQKPTQNRQTGLKPPRPSGGQAIQRRAPAPRTNAGAARGRAATGGRRR